MASEYEELRISVVLDDKALAQLQRINREVASDRRRGQAIFRGAARVAPAAGGPGLRDRKRDAGTAGWQLALPDDNAA
jgi:hypothetical protein